MRYLMADQHYLTCLIILLVQLTKQKDKSFIGRHNGCRRIPLHWWPISFYFVASRNRLFTPNKGFVQVYTNDLPILQNKTQDYDTSLYCHRSPQLPVWSSLRSVPKTLFNTSRAIKHIHLGPDPSCTCGPTVQSIGHSIAESVRSTLGTSPK